MCSKLGNISGGKKHVPGGDEYAGKKKEEGKGKEIANRRCLRLPSSLLQPRLHPWRV